MLVAVALALQRTRLGKATRAVSDNVDLASATGIDSQKVIRLVWVVGGAPRRARRHLPRPRRAGRLDMGAALLFLMFAGITLGGLGSAFGALVGGFIVGVFVEIVDAVRRADRAEERAGAGRADPRAAGSAAGHPRPSATGGLRRRRMDWTASSTTPSAAFVGINAVYFAIAAIGLNVQFGYAGLLNFGQAAFMACGAYGLGMTAHYFEHLDWWGIAVRYRVTRSSSGC